MMSEWTTHTLNDVCLKIYSGGTPSTKHSEYWNGDINWLSSGETSNKYIYETDRKISKLGVSKSSTQLAHKGDTVVASAGQGYTRGQASYLMIDTYVNQSVIVFHANTELIDNKYLFYNLGNRYEELRQLSDGTSTRGGLSGWIVKRMEINLPPIDEQKQIVGILSAIDDKIELNTAINENLEQQAQALYKAWFVDFEPFGGVIPDDWSIGTISDLSSDIICGKTPSTKKKEYYGDYMPFITIPDMHNNVYVIATERSLSEMGSDSQSKKTLPANSICVSCIGTAGLVALVAVDSQTNQQINSIIPKERYSSYYIFLLMQTFSEKINRLGQSGSTIVNLNKAQFGLMEALVPSISDMNDFDTIVKPLFEQILANQYENQQLAALRDTLLPKLMNGEIDVSEVKI